MACEHVVGRGLQSYHQSDHNQPVSLSGLEKDVEYNDHELPTQLRPDQYFKLEWALSEERQELVFDAEKEGRWGEDLADLADSSGN